jgi:hypothetical protein
MIKHLKRFPVHGWVGLCLVAIFWTLYWTLNGLRAQWAFFPLWLGVLLTAFFWEMWNSRSYPKWIYHVPWGNWSHIFEMPLLGYGGYLRFSLELFAMYHLAAGLFGNKRTDYVMQTPEA